MLRNVLTYRLTLAAAMIVIVYLATMSRHIPVIEDVSDKAGHILAFYTLGLLADFSWPRSGFRAPKLLSLLGYGLAIEIIQYFLPHRSFSLLDLGADAVGLLIYAGSVPLLKNCYPLSERFKAIEGNNSTDPADDLRPGP
jgi:VanZ family protein